MDGQIQSKQASMVSLEKRDEISKYAMNYIKANMETDRQIAQSMSQNAGILNGASEYDYAKSFELLI